MDDILKHVEANADVYLGWTAWAGGPWWSNYALSMEPKSSSDTMQMNAVEPHLAWNAPVTSPTPTPTPTPTPVPTTSSATCDAACPATCEAESMTKSTGGSTTSGWNIWSNGYVSTTRTFAAGKTTLTVYAAGQSAGGVWPHMVVSVGGAVVGSTNVMSTAYAPYAFTFDATAGAKEIRVTFDNDAVVNTEDRNLLVDKVVVGCAAVQSACTNQTFEAESMTKSAGGSTSGGWNLWSNGTVSTNATFGSGAATIVVRAAGTVAANTWPHFVVSVDGQTIGSGYASSTTYRDYSFPFTASAGTKQVRVTFDNDYASNKEDRNLLLDKVSVVCP
jgi:hypothetical protein